MLRCSLIVMALVSACGGDDDGDGGVQPCELRVDGDVIAEDECRMHLCYPTDGTYQDLSLGSSMGASLTYQLAFSVEAPTVFTAGQTYDLMELGMLSDLFLESNGVRYTARHGAVTREPDETAQLIVQTVHAPSATNVCAGYIDGFISVEMVELLDGGAIGAGRTRVQASLGSPR